MAMQSGESADGRHPGRAVKKRASQACHNCRTRKVKCDLVTSGVPCSNCKSDDVECVVVESRRSRKYRLQKRRLSGLVSLQPLTQAPARLTTASSLASLKLSPDTLNSVPAQTSHDEAASKPSSTSSTQPHSSPASTTPAASFSAQGYGYLTGSVATNLPPQPPPPPPVTFPSYIQPPQPDIRPDDVEFLNRRGALTLPQPELQDQLLRCFVLFVYPSMPTVDLEDFLGAIDGRDGAPKISLVVFQAVMFAGTAYVDLDLLRQAGYQNRRAARSDFYQKVKLLYDFNWDVDRIALIQALLILNYWYVSENDQKDPWHWLGICVSLATSIGMNQTDTYSRKDPRTCRLWKRIWWNCVMRDRIIAFSMRRAMRVMDEDINLPWLTPDDFELRPISTLVPSLRQSRFVTDSSLRRMLAEMCVAQAQLLLTIGHIIKSCYTLRSFGGSTSEVTMLYTPRRSEAISSNDVAALQDELSQWYSNLPMSCWLLANAPAGNGNADGDWTDDILFLHRSALKMLFLVATEALNRPQTLGESKSHSASGPRQRSTSTSKVKEAADKMSEMIQCLHDRDLVRYLPPLAVSFMLLASAAFLVEIKTNGAGLGDLQLRAQQWQLHRCVRALLHLRDIWPIADSACDLVGQMINRAQVGPALGLAIPGTQAKSMGLMGSNEAAVDTDVLSSQFSAGQHSLQPALEPAQSSPQPYHYDRPIDDGMTPTFTPVSTAELKASTPMGVAQAPHEPVLAPELADRYPWTGAGLDSEELALGFNFDHTGIANERGQIGHGHISNGHALHMDIALAECYSLGDFENSILDFDFDSAAHGFSYGPAVATATATESATASAPRDGVPPTTVMSGTWTSTTTLPDFI
ncbi:hypothetical protein A1O3_08744 [Capronia epimyces CBS 606.96]|uniref:Zn(2)-C6 fungal-type domain-containing protein n=1 Tax=Capronia epimyces CBS 606.96 TaxID=1182542 RepID=W9XG70_9EURO|nr:uncharacterized protein A1O3_08744 [Capronia epimyces CBS 606.96]EXJ79243.1 hypothetical protein A1O3_08744 [Capronia epimyces CBS 606.96]